MTGYSTPESSELLHRRFADYTSSIPPHVNGREARLLIHEAGEHFAHLADQHVRPGAERDEGFQHLLEAVLWFDRGIETEGAAHG